jgi:hypothetical protein
MGASCSTDKKIAQTESVRRLIRNGSSHNERSSDKPSSIENIELTEPSSRILQKEQGELLGDPLRVVAGLSPMHFAAQFRKATGCARTHAAQGGFVSGLRQAGATGPPTLLMEHRRRQNPQPCCWGNYRLDMERVVVRIFKRSKLTILSPPKRREIRANKVRGPVRNRADRTHQQQTDGKAGDRQGSAPWKERRRPDGRIAAEHRQGFVDSAKPAQEMLMPIAGRKPAMEATRNHRQSRSANRHKRLIAEDREAKSRSN